MRNNSCCTKSAIKRVRIGNDIPFTWTITRNGQPTVIPEVYEVRVYDRNHARCKVEYSAEDNKITGVFRGKDHKALGEYMLEYTENKGTINMASADVVPCWMLVPHSYLECNTDIESCDNCCCVDVASDIVTPHSNQ